MIDDRILNLLDTLSNYHSCCRFGDCDGGQPDYGFGVFHRAWLDGACDGGGDGNRRFDGNALSVFA